MSDFTNEFSWSRTRDRIFQECHRKYYFQHYGSWGGWDQFAGDRVRELYTMKNLTTRPAWIGQVVHNLAQAIVSSLRTDQPLLVSPAVQRLRDQMEWDWETSRSGRFRQRPNKMVGLLEHYYGMPLSSADLEEDYSYAEQCVQSIYATAAYQELARTPSIQFLEIENLNSFDLSGVKVWLKVDLAFQPQHGQAHIVDWKTGRYADPEDTELQLAVYAYYAARKWHIAAERIVTREVRLGYDEEIVHRMDGGLLGYAEDYIRRSAEGMKALLADPDRNIANEEDFEMTVNYQRCRDCNYRRACGREGI